MKPTLVFLVVPYLLVWAVFRRRWRFVLGFSLTLAIVSIGSLLIAPNWIGEWLVRVTRYSEYTVGQSPVWLLTHQMIPSLGSAVEMGILTVLLLGLLAAWWHTFRGGGEDWFFWTLGLTLVVSNLIVPRSATTNYVLMLIPILCVFAALDRLAQWGRPVLLAALLISFAGLWWLHFATVVGNQEQAIMFIPAPLILGCSLLFGYRWLIKDARENKLGF
jgi:hypothetical protein